MDKLLIGISGKKYSGKDTLCSFLQEEASKQGYLSIKRAFADALKEEVAEFLVPAYNKNISSSLYGATSLDLIKAFNDPGIKENFRLLLQWWGTEFRRKQFSDTYWLDTLDSWIDTLKVKTCKDKESLHGYNTSAFDTIDLNLNNNHPILVIIPDVRFENEAKFIKDKDGVLIRINRNLDNKDEHTSETQLDEYKFDLSVDNSGDKDYLHYITPAIFAYVTRNNP